MRRIFRLTHEPDYYRGLGLLLASCLALVWALWRDAFTPQVFLAGFLCFSWGYAFLWRYDLNQRLSSLQAEVEELKRRFTAAEAKIEDRVSREEGQEAVEVPEAIWTQEMPADIVEPAFLNPETDTNDNEE